jgi:hypothetical protein
MTMKPIPIRTALRALAAVTLCSGCVAGAEPAEISPAVASQAAALEPADCPADDSLPYDKIQQRAIHNMYTRDEVLGDQLLYHKVRAFEWDIHAANEPDHEVPTDNEWFIYHGDPNTDRRNYDTLSEGLKLLAAYHRAVPQHEVVTVMLEFKDPDGRVFRSTFDDPTKQSPAGLDARLRAMLPAGSLFTPRDLLDWCEARSGTKFATLREAVQAPTCGWPSTDELRGKIMFDMYGGGDGASDALGRYAPDEATAHARVGFLMPGYGGETPSWVVKLNNVGGVQARALRADANTSRFILRSAGVIDDEHRGDFLGLQSSGLNLINTDCVEMVEAPWADTSNYQGYPFCPVGRTLDECRLAPETKFRHELGHQFELDSYSGDIQDTRDNFIFQAGPLSWPEPGQVVSYQAFVGGSNNRHVNSWSKGCIMARASSAPDSAYVAVCRPGNDHPISLQYRAEFCDGPCGTAGTGATAGQLEVRHVENASYVRLDMFKDSNGRTYAQAYGSADGASWSMIGETLTFFQPLELIGLGSSSWNHEFDGAGGPYTSFRFANFSRDGVPLSADDIPSYFAIGDDDDRPEGRFADWSLSPRCSLIGFDMRALSVDSFGVYDVPRPWMSTQQVQTLTLPPGEYVIQQYSSQFTDVRFYVKEDGTIDYDGSLEGGVHGKGTRTLQVTGFPVTLDASQLSSTRLLPMWFDAHELDSSQPLQLTLPPSPGYAFFLGSGQIANFGFGVDPQGHVTLPAELSGMASIPDPSTVRVTGFPVDVTLSSSGSTWVEPNLLGMRDAPLPTNTSVRLNLLPLWVGAYSFSDDIQNVPFVWNLGMDGKVEYDASYDDVASGRGTSALSVTVAP